MKAFATVWGAGAARYANALLLATAATVLGAVSAVAIAPGLVAPFSGHALLPEAVVAQSGFPACVGFAACLVVLLASRLGWPVSTTHALVGGLLGTTLASGVGADVPTF